MDLDFTDLSDGSDYVPDAKPKAVAKKAPAKKTSAASTKAAPKKAPTKRATATKKPIKKAPVCAADENTVDDIGTPSDDGAHSALVSTPEDAVAPSTAAPSGTGTGQPLASNANRADASSRYQKLSQLEHIIKRPDTYIGSIERTDKHMWVYNREAEAMEYREVSYVPGLYKILDEIIVNAADNKQNDQNMDEIRITMDKEAGELSVWNNGRGIPVEIHKKDGIYIPEMIFGHLLTSSNYDDEQQKVTGGRNGYGAKLCNIFSTEFTLETADSVNMKKYKQTWTNNMSKMGKARITDLKKADDYTKVTFKPDFARFGMEGIDDDFEALVLRRVYDLAGTSKCAVKFNGSRIPVRTFKKYMEMYTKAIKKERGEEAANDKTEIITESPDPRWEIGFAVSDGSFQQVSFVNSIATTSGGTHVNYIADQICNKLADSLKKKNKTGATLKAAQIRNHIFLFVNCLVVNPAFTSQTKEQLTTKASQFGSKCVLSDEFLKKIQKTQVMENIMHFAQQKADQIMKKTDGHRRSRMNNPKLTDANKAGTKEGYLCTLLLTEGDSAKALAMAGRSVVGPDYFGVFPLRGKLLNVRDASVDQISKNAEIQNIKNFLGLQHKKEYTDTKGLRYGHLMIMTDQDHDGSHIKGLLINYFQVAFPSLLKIPQFLLEFITPIVRVWKGDPKEPSQLHTFFTMPEYEAWKRDHGHEKGWDKKYYKGLGTSTTEDGEEYFRDLDRHLKQFHVMREHEPALIDLAFSKKKADERKEWLRQFKPGTYLEQTGDTITYDDFINKELILFSMADNIRSIPSVVDGFKPGQRKVMYACLKKNIRKDIKVYELGGYVSAETSYQHGDASMQQTIVALAQDFVGSNNVNLLEPSGNFGSRLHGGADAASARYIHTRLTPFARRIFSQHDDALLTYNTDEGKKIEPQYYVPVLPMLLINGADGIGTGWSTNIPNYNPEDVVENIKRLIRGEAMVPMKPWYKGFTGEVVDLGGERFKFSGRLSLTGDNEVEITELPVRTWTQDFKDKLEELIKGDKTVPFVKDYKDYNTHRQVHFVIQLDEKYAQKAIAEGLDDRFKMSKVVAASNLVAFDPEGRITKYGGVEDIMKEFYLIRLKFYEKRKQYMLSELQKQLDRLTNQARFITEIIDGKLVISKKPKRQLMAELKAKNFTPFSTKANQDPDQGKDLSEVLQQQEDDEEDSQDEGDIPADAYDYLLNMPLWSLTMERLERLRRQIGDKETEIDDLIKLSKEDLWMRDIDEFMEIWRASLADEHDRMLKSKKQVRRTSTKLKTANASKRKRKPKDDDDEFELAPKKKAPRGKAAKAAEAQGTLYSFLQKERPAPAAAPAPATVPPASKASPPGILDDDDDDVEIMPVGKTKSRGAAALRQAFDLDKPSSESASASVSTSASALAAASISPPPGDAGTEQEKRDSVTTTQAAATKQVKGPTSAGPSRVASRKKPSVGSGSDEAMPDLDDEDEDAVLTARPSRTARAAKPATYALSDSDDENHDLLDELDDLVGGSDDLDAELHESKDSSAARASKSAASAVEAPDDDDDDIISKPTSRAKAAPKAAARTAKAVTKPKAAPKAAPRAAAKTKAPPKPKQLSPAGKAYAAKIAKAEAAEKAKEASAGDDDDDLDALMDDIMGKSSSPVIAAKSASKKKDVYSDDSGDDDDIVAAAPAGRNAPVRTLRRSATAKKTYTFDDSDEEDSQGSADFDAAEEDSDDDF
ncbi:DNA topoisomerase 2 [Ascosphaera acerosa]|nr:DNA topoisomerase 2 [Ascosphaera acerosa]